MAARPSKQALVAVLAMVLSIVLLAVYAVVYYDDFKYVATVKEGSCTTINSSYYRGRVYCSCSTSRTVCHSAYQCLSIYVILDQSGPPSKSLKGTGGHKSNAVPDPQDKIVTQLFEDDDAMNFRYATCTVKPKCYRVQELTAEVVAKFDSEYGRTGTTFTCYYLPHAPEKVIHSATLWSKIRLWFIWPTGIIILSSCVLINVKSKRPGDDICTIFGLHLCLGRLCKQKEQRSANAISQEELQKWTCQALDNYPLQQNMPYQAPQHGGSYRDPEYLPNTYGRAPRAPHPAYDLG